MQKHEFHTIETKSFRSCMPQSRVLPSNHIVYDSSFLGQLVSQYPKKKLRENEGCGFHQKLYICFPTNRPFLQGNGRFVQGSCRVTKGPRVHRRLHWIGLNRPIKFQAGPLEGVSPLQNNYMTASHLFNCREYLVLKKGDVLRKSYEKNIYQYKCSPEDILERKPMGKPHIDPILCCAKQHCTILNYTMLYCTMLWYAVLFRATLY